MDIFQLSALHSPRSYHRLEQIASLRARGVGNHIDLPQLVVSGDQSAGKSSVLEGLTGLPFPRQDGVCTRFGTEILLEHTDSGPLHIVASVIPCKTRDEESATALRAYVRRLDDFLGLPEVIHEVGNMMGIKGFGNNVRGPSFVRDLLRVKVSGPVGLHLSIVDLPGIITVPNEEQTEADVDTVHDLVDTYISNPRTIILAVVQAGNDIANQSIIKKSRKYDPDGARTVGIITKPDLINEGTERRIALLAKNQDSTKLRLGYFLLKNPSPKELGAELDVNERRRRELAFFQSSPWREQGLSMERVGIASLQIFLQQLLDQHIEHELPKVREEIRALIVEMKKRIENMGEERPDLARMRLFLSRLSMAFHKLTIAALTGGYHDADPSFFPAIDDDKVCGTRLRALIHQLHIDYARNMRENGMKRKIIVNPSDVSTPESESADMSSWLQPDDKGCEGPILVTRQQMLDWVKKTYRKNRGKELPGNTNHVLLSELFHVQASRWRMIAESHVAKVQHTVVSFMRSALQHVVKEDLVRSEILEIVLARLADHARSAKNELAHLCEDEEQQPITYNHYYTDNIQRSRQDALKSSIEKAMRETTQHEWNGKLHVSNNTVDGQKLLASLQQRINVDMDVQACEEALSGLNAYYKVALKTFVDNVCKQVIERHLLRVLPEVFPPDSVVVLSDEDLNRIAAEPHGNAESRQELQTMLEALIESLNDLRR